MEGLDCKIYSLYLFFYSILASLHFISFFKGLRRLIRLFLWCWTVLVHACSDVQHFLGRFQARTITNRLFFQFFFGHFWHPMRLKIYLKKKIGHWAIHQNFTREKQNRTNWAILYPDWFGSCISMIRFGNRAYVFHFSIFFWRLMSIPFLFCLFSPFFLKLIGLNVSKTI